MPDDILSRHSDSACRFPDDSGLPDPSAHSPYTIAHHTLTRLFDRAAADLALPGSTHLEPLPLRYEPVPLHLIALACAAYRHPRPPAAQTASAAPIADVDPALAGVQSGLYLLYRSAAAGTLSRHAPSLLRETISRAAHEATRGPFVRETLSAPPAITRSLDLLAASEALRLLAHHTIASRRSPRTSPLHAAGMLAFRLTDQPAALHLALAHLYPSRPRTQRRVATQLLVDAATYDGTTTATRLDCPRPIITAAPTAVDAHHAIVRHLHLRRGTAETSATALFPHIGGRAALALRCPPACTLMQATRSAVGAAGAGLDSE